MSELDALGWECAVCGARRDIADALPFRCPNATAADRHHVLRLRSREHLALAGTQQVHENEEGNPFVRYDTRFAWAAFAAAHGMSGDARRALVETVDSAIGRVDGVGFRVTPFARSGALSDQLGFSSAGGVWVKDETHNVAGSHKARHLMSVLLHLLAAESLGMLDERPPLAIASCGNAALAAATLAAAAGWPIDVFVPTWMSDDVGDRLHALGAAIHRCERLVSDPPGDPAMLRFREAVGAGAIPFTVQGPENALCLDGGRTIAWEMLDQSVALGIELDRVFVQVGGGAFATCMGDGFAAAASGARLHAVQTAGCAPLARGWNRAAGLDRPEQHWGDVMTVWDDPHSLADGILDDETYDWIGVFENLRRSGGEPVVASEPQIEQAHAMAVDGGFDVSPTGSAGLAGLLAARDRVGDDERVAVVMSGVAR